MTDLPELKPCPFCGGKVEKQDNQWSWDVFTCTKCETDFEVYTKDPINFWNTRVSHD